MDLTIHRVRDLLKDTPRNLTESDWPTFLLEHAIAAYEDGSPANLLAPVPGRTVFLCGTIILEDDQLSVCKKDGCAFKIQEELSGPIVISHASGPLTLWVEVERKWFEMVPSRFYQQAQNEMGHVAAIFWANDNYVKQRPLDNKYVDVTAELAFAYMTTLYVQEIGSGSINFNQLLKLLDKCGGWLLQECSRTPILSSSPLMAWLGVMGHKLPGLGDLGSEIAGEMRERETAVSLRSRLFPCSLYPEGFETFPSISVAVNAIALHALEYNQRSLDKLTGEFIANRLERLTIVPALPVAHAILRTKRQEILSSLPPIFHNTPLHKYFSRDTIGKDHLAFDPRFENKFREAHDDFVSGRKQLTRSRPRRKSQDTDVAVNENGSGVINPLRGALLTDPLAFRVPPGGPVSFPRRVKREDGCMGRGVSGASYGVSSRYPH